MNAHARTGTRLLVLLRRTGVALAVAAIAASVAVVWTTARAKRLSSKTASAIEMVYTGAQAQRALSLYNKQSDLFRRTRGSGNEIERTGPERELQHFLTLLDRCAKERPRGGHFATAAAAKVRAYVVAREDWQQEDQPGGPDKLPAAIAAARDEADTALAVAVRENYELARTLQQQAQHDASRANAIGWSLAAIVLGAITGAWYVLKSGPAAVTPL